GEQALNDALHILPEISACRRDLTIDAGFHLANKEGVALVCLPALPRHAVSDECQRTLCLLALRIETHIAQQRQDVHGGVPPAIPCHATPRPVLTLHGEESRSPALGGDLRPLCRHFRRWRIDQVSHHLPADRRVRIKQPVYNRTL